MTSELLIYICLVASLACALVAGVFQSFSDFVMRALVAAQPAGGMESMQMINRTVFRSIFLVTMLGLGPASVAMGLYAYYFLTGPAMIWIVAGSVTYFIGVILVTMLGNVPMNNRLDRMDHSSSEAVSYWHTYGVVWTRWNHVRAIGAFASAICFLIAGFTIA